MTALVDDTFRVFAAARQGDMARLDQLLQEMTDGDIVFLAQLLTALRQVVATELAVRAARIAQGARGG